MLAPVSWLVQMYHDSLPNADPRVKDWFLISDSPIPVWCLTAFYLAVLGFGPRFMKNRRPFNLQSFMFVYNMGCVILSVYMFAEILLSAYDAGYGLFCTPYNKQTPNNPKELRVAKVLWWYFFSKVIEFNDTFLMVLRKKWAQITFLHVFHHATMFNIWWWVIRFTPGGLAWFGSALNCLVHIVMYSYYGLAAIPALRNKLWWKKYITRFQLVQFCITLSHTCYATYVNCDFPTWGKTVLIGYMVIMLVLFANFYIHAYAEHRRRRKDNASAELTNVNNGFHHSNGAHNNGVVSNGSTKKSM